MSDHPIMPTDAESAIVRYRSESCVIDLSARTLVRDGDLIDVEAKVFDLIDLLVRHRDRAMSKRELSRALWGDRPVTDAALSQLLRKARRALGDDGETQRFIRTVHGHGLQWIAAIETEPPRVASVDAGSAPVAAIESVAETDSSPISATSPLSHRSNWKYFGIILALLVLGVSSMLWKRGNEAALQATPSAVRIQVLPTRDYSGEPDLGWTHSGLMGLMSSLIRNEPGIDVVLAADRNDNDALSDIDIDDSAALTRLQAASGATHVVATALRKLGSLFELELRVLALGDNATYHEVLRGSSPAALAADAAERIRSRFRRTMSTVAEPLLVEIKDPFIAEVYARGLDAQLRGDQAGARKYFDICLDHQPELLWPRLHLAIAQIATGDSAAARENAQAVEIEAKRRGLTTLHIQALRQLASIAFRNGDLDGAAQHLGVAMNEITLIDQPMLRSDLLVANGSIESERGEWKLARSQLDEALRLALTAGDRRRQANALTNLAVVENATGDSAAALTRLRSALDAARAASDGALEASILLNLGGAEYNAGHPLDAAALLKQSLRLSKQRSDRQSQVFSAIMLSWILAAFDHTDDAQRLAEAVARIGEADGNPLWQAEAHWALSNVHSRIPDWSRALAELERAQALFESKGMQRNRVQVLSDTVQTALSAGDPERARLAAESYRSLTGNDAQFAAELSIIDAQLRYADGKSQIATAALAEFVRARRADRGPAAQSALFVLGRWQIAAKDFKAFLDEPAWTTWLSEMPDAIKLRIEALEQAGEQLEAATEMARLRRMQESEALQLESELFSIP